MWLDGPPQSSTAEACAEDAPFGDVDECGFILDEGHLERWTALESAMDQAGIDTIAQLDWFCDVETMRCPDIVNGVPVYADQSHITGAFAMTLGQLIRGGIAGALDSG